MFQVKIPCPEESRAQMLKVNTHIHTHKYVHMLENSKLNDPQSDFSIGRVPLKTSEGRKTWVLTHSSPGTEGESQSYGSAGN